MSINGFAGSPGTDVEPTCSIRTTRSPSTERIRSSSRAERRGHSGSYSRISIGRVRYWTSVETFGRCSSYQATSYGSRLIVVKVAFGRARRDPLLPRLRGLRPAGRESRGRDSGAHRARGRDRRGREEPVRRARRREARLLQAEAGPL